MARNTHNNIGNNTEMLPASYVKQLLECINRAEGTLSVNDVLVEVKEQTKNITKFHIYTTDRKATVKRVATELRKRGMDEETGRGYKVREHKWGSSKFPGWEYDAPHQTGSHKIRLRFKELHRAKGQLKSPLGQTVKKENKGIIFEKELNKDFLLYAKNGTADAAGIKYKTFLKDFPFTHEDCGLCINEVYHSGGQNTRRPLMFSGSSPYIGPNSANDTNIGDVVTDITIDVVEGRKEETVYCSLKYGPTVTFVNTGVKTIFRSEDFDKGKTTLSNPDAKSLLKLWGIDEGRFIKVFQEAARTEHQGKLIKGSFSKTKDESTVTNKVDMTALHTFIKTCVGYGYWMIHLSNNGTINHYKVTRANMNRWTKPTSVIVYYPKTSATGATAKRVDVVVETPKYQLKMNIRNKQAGIYPTHLMLDYKIKN